MFLRKPSPAEIESRFTAAEDRRQGAFSKSMLEYRQRFIDEEKTRQGGEQWRNEEFNQMIVFQDDAFESISEKRDKAFQNEQARRRVTVQVQDSLREKRFSEVESSRTAHFLVYQETIEKRGEWFARIRESHLQKGRQEREEICKQLEKDMKAQSERLLRWQEECFALAEKQRAEIVREVVTNGNFPSPSTSPSTSNGVLHDARDSGIPNANQLIATIPGDPPTTFYPFPISTPNGLQGPAESVRVSLPVAPYRPRSISPSRRSHGPSSVLLRPVRMPNPQGDVTQLLFENDRFSVLIDGFEKRFRLIEEQRQQEFLQEDEQSNLRFSEAEAAKDEAELSRTHICGQREDNREQKFQAMMSLHRNEFEGSEVSRDWQEDWRTQESQVAEEGRTQSFNQTLVLIQKQYYALDALEDDALESMKRRITKVSKSYVELFEQGRRQRHTASSLSQKRRELELQVLEFDPSLSVNKSQLFSAARRKLHRRWAWLAGGFAHTPSPVRSQMMPLSWYQRRPSPPTGFNPKMLFRGPDLHKPLPVPGAQEHVAAKEISHLRGRRQLIFEKAQAEREKMFENGIRSRRRIFNVNEAKREANFERLQRTRKETAVQQEHDRSTKFENARDERQRLFQDAERLRESGFHEAERKRAEAYKAAQTSRDAKFHSIQNELQNQCFKSEISRTSEFEEWCSNLLRSTEQEQTEGYKIEERDRERVFTDAVDLKKYVVEL